MYHYFPAKEDLFTEVHREGFRQLIARVEEITRSEADPWRRIELACAAHIERLKADREHYEQIFRRLVVDLGLPRAIYRSLFRLVLLGALNWAHVWYRKGKKSPRDIARAIIKMFRGNWAL